MEPYELLFRNDAYLSTCEACVSAVDPQGHVRFDRTIFYPQGGGQPGDTGWIERADGSRIIVTDSLYGPDRAPLVQAGDGAMMLQPGERVVLHLDWARRYRFMRVHTALHLLSVILPYPVTGGQIGDGEGRLDFDLEEGQFDKGALSAELTALAARDLAVTSKTITDEALMAQPGLVKTMSVKPPMGSGTVRLIRIGDVDLQPCGGTHVASTLEVGAVTVTKIEKKGRQNRRFKIALTD